MNDCCFNLSIYRIVGSTWLSCYRSIFASWYSSNGQSLKDVFKQFYLLASRYSLNISWMNLNVVCFQAMLPKCCSYLGSMHLSNSILKFLSLKNYSMCALVVYEFWAFFIYALLSSWVLLLWEKYDARVRAS